MNYNVYHYTTPETVRSILDGKTLRFTYVKDLDDKNEFRYLFDYVSRIIDRKYYEYRDNLFGFITDYYNN